MGGTPDARQTLFVRSDEVEASWELYDPILDPDLEPHPHPAGTWGLGVHIHGIDLGDGPWMSR